MVRRSNLLRIVDVREEIGRYKYILLKKYTQFDIIGFYDVLLKDTIHYIGPRSKK